MANPEKRPAGPKPGREPAELYTGRFIERVSGPHMGDFEANPLASFFSKQAVTEWSRSQLNQPGLLIECFVWNHGRGEYPRFRVRKKGDLPTQTGNGTGRPEKMNLLGIEGGAYFKEGDQPEVFPRPFPELCGERALIGEPRPDRIPTGTAPPVGMMPPAGQRRLCSHDKRGFMVSRGKQRDRL